MENRIFLTSTLPYAGKPHCGHGLEIIQSDCLTRYYKCQRVGIEVRLNEESYTSKCSALDLEPICKHSKYLGVRNDREFKTAQGIVFNSDINGSLNIGRKIFGDKFVKEFINNNGQRQCPIKIP